MDPLEQSASDEQLLHRVRGEYLEMPGLRLTREQAQRLWAVDATTCTRLLDCLTDTKFLQRDANGRYARIGDGSARRVPIRMLKTDINVDSWQSRPTLRIRSKA